VTDIGGLDVRARIELLNAAAVKHRDASCILACMPADRALRAQLVAGLDVPVLEPSIEHTLGVCDACEAEVWVGPRQNSIPGAMRLCMLCAAIVHTMTGHSPVTLNPNEADIPRRT